MTDKTIWVPKAGEQVRVYMNPVTGIGGGLIGVRFVHRVTPTGWIRVMMDPKTKATALFKPSVMQPGTYRRHLSDWNWHHIEPNGDPRG